MTDEVADSDDSLLMKHYVLLRWPSELQLNRVDLFTVMGVFMRLNQSA